MQDFGAFTSAKPAFFNQFLYFLKHVESIKQDDGFLGTFTQRLRHPAQTQDPGTYVAKECKHVHTYGFRPKAKNMFKVVVTVSYNKLMLGCFFEPFDRSIASTTLPSLGRLKAAAAAKNWRQAGSEL